MDRISSSRRSGGTTRAISRPQDGRRFGFQLTFFRRGLSPGAPPASGLATNQIYFAHFALTDVAAGSHRSAERFSRGAAGLAGADARPFRVWLEDWTVESRNADGSSLARPGPRRQDASGPGARGAEAPRRPRRPGRVAQERRAGQRLLLRRLHTPGRPRTDRQRREATSPRPARPGSTTSGARAPWGPRPWAGTGGACSSTTIASSCSS